MIVTNVNFEDPFCDDMKTLMQKAKSPKIKALLELSKTLQGDTREFVEEEIQRGVSRQTGCINNDNNDNISVLKSMRVKLSESDPKTLDNIGGMKETKAAINEFIVQPWSPKYRAKIKKGNIDMPNGFLMTGPPGVVKRL